MTNVRPRLPLEGIKILALSQFGAGPYGTLLLADLGAEVIKIEDPKSGGDVSRYIPPYTAEADSLYFQSYNRNKKSMTLDLKTEEGRVIFRKLVAQSDAVFNNLRGDQPAKLGLDYAALGKTNPKIVCCSLSAFGTTGPRSAEPGYDYLMQALAGYMSFTGEPGGPPAKCGVSVVDHAAGLAAALGLVVGLFNAQRTGAGCDVDVSLLDTAISMLTYLGIWNLNKDYNPERFPDSAHQTIVPAQNFETKDGYLVIFCAKEKFWKELCTVLGIPELITDPRSLSFHARMNNRDFVVSTLQSIFRTEGTSHWVSRLQGKVPVAAVNSLGHALNEPQVLARGMIVDVDHPAFGNIREVGSPIHIGGGRKTHDPAPSLGQHTESILGEWLGYGSEQIRALRKEGVI